jgi:para-nitrobenzyl esterase
VAATAYIQERGRMKGLRWGPAVDREAIPVHPAEAVDRGLAADVDVMIGTDLDEFRLMAAGIPGSATVDGRELAKRLAFLTPGEARGGRPLGEAAIEAYTAIRTARGESVAAPDLYSAIPSDHMFRYPSIRLAEALAAHNPNTCMFLYTHPSPMESPRLGACHGLEIPLIFGSYTQIPEIEGSGPDLDAFALRLQEAWVAFARDGSPATPALGEWPAYDAGRRATMLLAPRHALVDDPLGEERRFWAENFR